MLRQKQIIDSYNLNQYQSFSDLTDLQAKVPTPRKGDRAWTDDGRFYFYNGTSWEQPADAMRPFLASFGWVRTLGTFRYVDDTSRTVEHGGIAYARWNDLTQQSEVLTYPAASPVTFDLYKSDGLVAASQTVIDNQQWDNGGTLTALNANNVVAHRVLVNPLDGKIAVVYGQRSHGNLNTATSRQGSDPAVVPPALANYQLAAIFFVNQNAGNLFSNGGSIVGTASELGSIIVGGSVEAPSTFYLPVADAAARDAIINPGQGTVVGVLDDDGNGQYAEYRIITTGATFAAATTIKTYPAADSGLRGEPVADNTALTALPARDYERRKVLADGKEYVFELGAVAGTLPDDGATGFWQEQVSDFSAILIDSSAAATVETLPAATGSGAIRFYVNKNVTNTATLAVQPGESLAGVTDGTLLFSSYAAGTQFRVDDVAVGKWVVAIDGASTSTSLGRFTYEIDNGTTDLVNHTAAGDGSYGQSDIVPLSAANVTQAGVFDVVGNTLVCNTAGEYEVHAEFLLFDSGGTNSTSIYAYVGDGTSQIGFASHDRAGANLYANASKTFTKKFQVGDVLDFRIATPSVEDASCRGLLVDVREVPSSEVVLAGMVAPTSLVKYNLTTGSTVFASVDGAGAYDIFPLSSVPVVSETNLDGMKVGDTIVIPKAGDYRLWVSAHVDTADTEVAIFVNGSVVASQMAETDVGGASCESLLPLAAGDVVEFGQANTNSRNWAYLNASVQELPTSTVVMPAEDLGYIYAYLSTDTAGVQVGTPRIAPLNAVVSSRGLSLNANGSVTLKAGKVYDIAAKVDGSDVWYHLWDITNDVRVSHGSQAGSPTAVHSIGDIIHTLVSPASDFDIAIGGAGATTYEGSSYGVNGGKHTYMIVKELPTLREVVNTTEVPVEDVGVTLFSGTVADFGTATLDGGVTWGDVVSNYEKGIIYSKNSSSGQSYPSIEVLTSQFVGTNDTFVLSIGPSSSVTYEQIDSSDGDFRMNNTLNVSFDVIIVGVKAQKTVINPDFIPADNTSVADGDTLVWNAANGQYEPGAYALAPAEDLIFSGTGLTNSTTYSLDSLTWQEVLDEYEYIKVVVTSSNGNVNIISHESRLDSITIAPTGNVTVYQASTESSIVSAVASTRIGPAGLATGNFLWSSAVSPTGAVRIYGRRTTVIPFATVSSPITITAVTADPVKPTTVVQDEITVIDDGSGWCECILRYSHNPTGTVSNSGSGTYYFELPGGYAFSPDEVGIVQSAAASFSENDFLLSQFIPAYGRIRFDTTFTGQTMAIVPRGPDNTPRNIFSVVNIIPGDSSQFMVGGGSLSMVNTVRMGYQINFRFKKA